MNTHKYTCFYCHEEYVPKRRYAQKYCSNSCRSKAYHRRQVESGATKMTPTKVVGSLQQMVQPSSSVEEKKSSNDKITLASIGSAAAGSLAADLLKSLLTSEDSKPATKGDILSLLKMFERYQAISNLPHRNFGKRPYFDLYTNEIVYF